MYLHIGETYYISLESIICIFDIKTSDGMIADSFIKKAAEENRIIYTCEEKYAHSAIAVIKEDSVFVYISSVSSSSLGRRRYSTLKNQIICM